LDGPELPRPEETHLNFIIHEEDLPLFKDLLEPDKVFLGRDHVAPCPLNRFHVKGAKFTLTGLRVPNRVVLGVKELLELLETVQTAILSLQPVEAAEAVGVGDKVGPVCEMTIAVSVTIAGGDRCGSQGAAMVGAHEGKAGGLMGIIAHELDGVLYG
jgi:hypothetical protein